MLWKEGVTDENKFNSRKPDYSTLKSMRANLTTVSKSVSKVVNMDRDFK